MSARGRFTANEIVDSARSRIGDVLPNYVTQLADEVTIQTWVAESPIEAMFIAALEFRSIVYLTPGVGVRTHFGGALKLDLHQFIDWMGEGFPPGQIRSIFVDTQVNIGPRRVDFLCGLVGLHSKRFLVVECDGHEFHVVNKQQAERDRRNDRVMLKDGIATMRFTGSEIYRDPIACVDEVIAYFRTWFDEECRSEIRINPEEKNPWGGEAS